MAAHVHVMAWSRLGESTSTINSNRTISDDAEQNIDRDGSSDEAPLIAGESTEEIEVDIHTARLRSLFMLASRDLTIKTNSADTPDDTIELKANDPFVWRDNGYHANPFAGGDVDTIHVINAGLEPASLRLRAILHSS